MAEQRKARPAWHRTRSEPADRQATSSQGFYGSRHRAELRANLTLRIAWLRIHAEWLYRVDGGGLLSAQLLDLADLLEVLDAEGRWDS